MEWSGEAIILSARRHGESSVIVNLLTPAHGRHAGLVRGGAGKRQRGVLQPGNRVEAVWRARLPEHLGTLTCELVHSHSAAVLDNSNGLAALSAACAVTQAALPEREPHGAVYEGLLALLTAIEAEAWPTVYVQWELGLLAELGFGLDLSECAATGTNDHLAYVSPKSGRAVSLAAGEPYRDKLLRLPAFLLSAEAPWHNRDIADGMDLTGFFLERHVLAQAGGRTLPAARQRLPSRLRRTV